MRFRRGSHRGGSRPLIILGSVLAGCGGGGMEPPTPGEVAGELGHGEFHFDSPEIYYSPQEVLIGVDSTFAVRFSREGRWNGEGDWNIVVESASPAIADPQGDAFVARSAGTVALLARDKRHDRIVDLFHAQVAEPARVV